ncbi:hypothetical protein [Azohydromonas aeria]|uniref:hypothetical protein n=1 Tax=Azohydromonas aeria TaxID=2590212 RepID=UPI0012F99552|nr:hypothetical protein [Azohydromonas aeria]
MKSPRRISLLLPALLAGAAAPALAVPFSVEGRLGRVNDNALVCNQVRIQLGANTVITTPSGVIDKARLLDTQPFPGRRNVEPPDDGNPDTPPLPPLSAFVGGTCIVSGDDNGTRRVADTVFVEVSENVLVGPVTITPGGPFEIMGVPIVLLGTTPGTPGYEPGGRIVASEPINDFGYEVDLATVPAGDESSAEGYLGAQTDVFYAHAIQTTGGQARASATAPDTRILRGSVTRANATTVKLEVRGGCRFMGSPNVNGTARTQRVNVQVDNGTSATGEVVWTNASAPATPAAGNVTCTEDTAAPGYGLFRYQLDRYSGYRAVPTMTRARVVPSSAYPSTAYSTDFVLDRAGF